MTRHGYSLKMAATVKALPHGNPRRLALACVENSVPVQYVAKYLGVTSQTVYNWFTGEAEPYKKYHAAIDSFVKNIKWHAAQCA